jgi:hypothetical protein
MDRSVRQTSWTHNGDECVAVVGDQLKWRSPSKKPGRFGIWKYGRTVVGIEPSGRVYLDPIQWPGENWSLIIECGGSVKIEYEGEADGQVTS